MDVPSALHRTSEVGIANLAPVGHTMSMKLSFIARLDNLIWPSQTPKFGETFEECLPRFERKWLATLDKATLAIRRPLYHHGLVRVGAKRCQPFQWLIYPLAPAHKRSINHRVLSVAILNNHLTKLIDAMTRFDGQHLHAHHNIAKNSFSNQIYAFH